MKVCIGGAGLAGLALGYHLKDSGIEFTIFEKDTRPGGLLKSESHGGYTFDIGGSHIMFSRDEGVLREMVNLVGSVVMHRRRTMIHYNGQFIKYPFENGIFALTPEERFEILLDFVKNLGREKKKPENLRDFFVQMFGEKIVDKYLGPYNEKIWKRKIEDLAMAWSSDRLPQPPVEDVLRAAVGIETEGYLHQLRFFYPLNGGIETLAKALYNEIGEKVRLGEAVESVDTGESVRVNDEECDYFVSTIPLPVLGGILGGEIEKLTGTLDYNSVTVVGLGVRGNLPDYHWLYVPDSDIIFHRLAFLSNYSPNMAPPGAGTIIAEISHRPGEKLGDVVPAIMEGLQKLGIDVSLDIAKVWDNHFAYVVTDHNYFRVMPELRGELEKKRILLLGRHGNWEYLNMDAVWTRTRDMAERLRGLK